MEGPHAGLVAFSDHRLDIVEAGRHLHLRPGGEAALEHVAVAGFAQVQLDGLLGTIHPLAVLVVDHHQQMKKIPAPFSLLLKGNSLDPDVGEDAQAVPFVLGRGRPVGQLQRNLVEISRGGQGQLNVFVLAILQ